MISGYTRQTLTPTLIAISNLKRRMLDHNIRQGPVLTTLIWQNGLIPIIITPSRPPNPDIRIIVQEREKLLEDSDAGIVRPPSELSQHSVRAVIAKGISDSFEEEVEHAPVHTVRGAAVQDVEVLVEIEDDLALGSLVQERKEGDGRAGFETGYFCGQGAGDEDAVVGRLGADGFDGFLHALCPSEGDEAPGYMRVKLGL